MQLRQWQILTRTSFNQFVRPHFAPALHAAFAFSLPTSSSLKLGGNIGAGAWTLSSKVMNSAGKVFPRLSGGFGFQPDGNDAVTFVGVGRCSNKIPGVLGRGGNAGPPAAAREALAKCVNSFHLHELISYQPVSRYWSFQWYEFGSYVVLSALLAWLGVWWILRH